MSGKIANHQTLFRSDAQGTRRQASTGLLAWPGGAKNIAWHRRPNSRERMRRATSA